MSPLSAFVILAGLALVWSPGPRAFAAEVADGGRSYAPRTEASPQSLGPSDAARLISGQIPTLDRLDQKYRQPGTTDRCQRAWRDLRRTPVRVRPVRAPLALIIANADRLNLSRRKVKNALAVFLKNQDELPNQRYVSIVDFDKKSSQPRLFTIDLATGRISAFHVSSSYGSSPTGNGVSSHFSNRVDESNANSLGCAVASGEYRGKHGRRSLILHGIESTNDNTCRRSIIMHAATYVGGDGPSRSEGCLAVKTTELRTIAERVGQGGLICSYREGPVYQARAYYKKPARRRHGARRSHHAPAPWRVHDIF
jgi:hypothetical protein